VFVLTQGAVDQNLKRGVRGRQKNEDKEKKKEKTKKKTDFISCIFCYGSAVGHHSLLYTFFHIFFDDHNGS
jgi:hypothetical protein